MRTRLSSPSLWIAIAAACALPASARAGVVINEFLPDPSSTDSGHEWLELYNNGTTDVDLSGYTIEAGTSSYATKYTFPSGTTLLAGDWLLVGDELVTADLNLGTGETLGLGNASTNADAVRLLDSAGLTVDTVVYGATNTDLWTDDTAAPATSLAPAPSSGKSIARVADGVDTDLSGDDFALVSAPTPDTANATLDTGDTGLPGACTPAVAIVINEFLPDPSGTDTGQEWLELYNADSVDADLTGYLIESGTSSYTKSVSLPAAVLAPGEFLVIGHSGVTGADVFDDSLSLSNAGSNSDAVRLSDCEGLVLDTVVYGTPNDDLWADDTGATAVSLGPKPSSGKTLARVADGLDTDESGVDFASGSATMGTSNEAPAVCDSSGPVKINEFMPDPAGTDAGAEWVELYNPTGAAIDVSGWAIASGTSDFSKRATLPEGTILEPNAFFVVGEELVAEADVVLNLDLGNASSSGDGVRLEDCAGLVLDTVVYGPDNADLFVDDTGAVATSTAPKPVSGSSLARTDDGLDTDQSGADFALAWPTPGLSNTTMPEDCGATVSGLKINELLPDPEGADEGYEWIELYNSGPAALDLGGWAIQTATSDSFSAKATLEPGVTLEPGGILLIGAPAVGGAHVSVDGFSLPNGTNGDAVRVVDCNGFPADTVAYGSTNSDGVIDDSGEPATSLAHDPPGGYSLQRLQDGLDTDLSGDDFALQSSPTPGASNPVIEFDPCAPSTGTVVINEILVNPDGADEGAEWFELYNSGGAQSLSGWYLSVATKAEDLGDVDIELPTGTAIGANAWFVVGGALVTEAELVKTFTLGNGTGGDALRLYDCEGNVVDTVIYGESSDDGLLDDQEAVVSPYGEPGEAQSLARVDDGVDSDGAEDWFADGSPTPGATNHQDPVVDTDGSEPPGGGGCNRRDDEAGPGGGCGGGTPDGEVGGCTTAPALPVNPAWVLLMAVAWRRRSGARR